VTKSPSASGRGHHIRRAGRRDRACGTNRAAGTSLPASGVPRSLRCRAVIHDFNSEPTVACYSTIMNREATGNASEVSLTSLTTEVGHEIARQDRVRSYQQHDGSHVEPPWALAIDLSEGDHGRSESGSRPPTSPRFVARPSFEAHPGVRPVTVTRWLFIP
jgi:hypothetical protein